MRDPDVVIPAFSIRAGKAFGLASAVLNLVSGLAEEGACVELAVSDPNRLPADFRRLLEGAPTSASVQLRRYPGVPGGMAGRFIEESLHWVMDQRNSPIFYPNYFAPPKLGRGRPTFVLIHDCQHRNLPEHFTRRKRAWLDLHFSRAIETAERVFTISEYEMSQLEAAYGDKVRDKCRVIYNAIDWARYDRSNRPAFAAPDRPFALGVAYQYPHKNTLKLLHAFDAVKTRIEHDLVLVGTPAREALELAAAINERGNRSRIIIAGSIPDSELAYLYRNASLFLSASRYEGFGMPAVEAMGFGVPALLSSAAALPEVTLRSATYLAPDESAEAWGETIHSCLTTPPPASELQALAARIRSRYDPRRIAKTVLNEIRGH